MGACRRLAAVALIALGLVACAGGIDRERAIEIARLHAGVTATTVLGAERGPLGQFADRAILPELSRDRVVWSVVLGGAFPGSCVPTIDGGQSCAPGATTKRVVLDALSGEFVYAESPAD